MQYILTVSWDCIWFSQFIDDSGPELVIIRLYREIFGILGNKTSPVYRTSWTNRKCCHVMKIKGWQTLVNFKCCHFADRINTRQAFSNLRMNTKKICSTRLGIFFHKRMLHHYISRMVARISQVKKSSSDLTFLFGRPKIANWHINYIAFASFWFLVWKKLAKIY